MLTVCATLLSKYSLAYLGCRGLNAGRGQLITDPAVFHLARQVKNSEARIQYTIEILMIVKATHQQRHFVTPRCKPRLEIKTE